MSVSTTSVERSMVRVSGTIEPGIDNGLLILYQGDVRYLEDALPVLSQGIHGAVFSCEEVYYGLYTVFVRSSTSEWWRELFYLPKGPTADLGCLELLAMPRGNRITGIVTDKQGQPIPSATVAYAETSASSFAIRTSVDWATQTREDGTFWLYPTKNPVELSIYGKGYAMQEVHVHWGEHVRVVLVPY